MDFSNKTVVLFFFCLNLLFSSHVAAGYRYYDPSATPPPPSSYGSTPPPPSTHGTPSTNGGPITGNGTLSPPTGGAPTCPLSLLSLGACANLFNGSLPVGIGRGPVSQCCTVIRGMADLDASICLCALAKARLLNLLPIDVNIAIISILNACGRNPPPVRCP